MNEPVDELPDVLVVDDEPGCREGMRRILVARGYRARTAADGREALERLSECDFPIMLVDLKMPEVDGFEVIERVRQSRPDTLCIVVSAFATIESAVRTTKMGAFDFVVKPFAPDDLMRVVTRAVEQWRLARAAARLRAEREAHLLELAAEKSRLRAIVQSMAEGLMVVNVDGEVVLDNAATRRILGRVGEETVSGPVRSLLGDEKFLLEIDRLMSGQSAEAGVVLEVPLGGGEAGRASERRFLRATVAPVRDGSGPVRGVVVLLADVTGEKELERMKLLFTSMVAHELKAPIGAVEGYLHVLASGALDGDPEKRSRTIGRCLERTGALLDLIRDLTDVARRDAGRHERRIASVDAGTIAGAIVDFQRVEADRRSVRITVDAQEGSALLIDQGDLEKIVTNLVSNAVKYNKEGGWVQVRVRREGPLVRLEVEDTGIGMSEEEVARVGEDFFRAKNEMTRTITGTGLGLALVKKIVADYHGRLDVVSRSGAGSTFTVLLPAAGGAARTEGASDVGAMAA